MKIEEEKSFLAKKKSQILNYRHKQQIGQLQYLVDNPAIYNQIIKESICSFVRYYEDVIWKNFIMYRSGDVKRLLVKLWKNVFACNSVYKLPCSFLLTAKQLTDFNEELGFRMSVKATMARLRLLEQEGVIGKIAVKNKGAFYYFKVDIRKPFDRKNLHAFKAENESEFLIKTTPEEQKEQQKRTREQEELIEEIKAPDDWQNNDNTQLKEEELKELVNKKREALKEEIKNNKGKIVADYIEPEQTPNAPEEEEKMDKTFQELEKMDIKDKSMQEFREMFIEFIGQRKAKNGDKIVAKNSRAVAMALNELKQAEKEGLNPYDVLFNALGEQWQGINLKYYKEKNTEKRTITKYGGFFNSNDGLAGFANELQVLKKRNPEQNIGELIASTTIMKAYAVQQLGKRQIDKQIKQAENQERQNKIANASKVFYSCKSYNKNTQASRVLFSNILSEEKKRGYDALIDYFAGCLCVKYPLEKERQQLFIDVSNAFPRLARDAGIKYIPRLFIYWYFVHCLDNWTEKVNYDFYDAILSNYQLLFNQFLEYAFNHEVSQYCNNGQFFQRFESVNFLGFLNDRFMTFDDVFLTDKDAKLTAFLFGRLLNQAVKTQTQLRPVDALEFVANSYAQAESGILIIKTQQIKSEKRDAICQMLLADARKLLHKPDLRLKINSAFLY